MSNNNVAILSIMSKFDEKSAKDAAKRANKVYDEELSNLGNVNFDEKLLKNFDKAMNLLKGKFKKVNLSPYTNNLLDSIFSDKDIKEKSTDINTFIKKIDLLKKAASGQDINAFNTLSAKQIDALIGRTEKLAKKQEEINEKTREYNREATKIAKSTRTVSTIDKKYGSQDYSKTLDSLKKSLTTEKDFTKEQNESIENLAKMVQLYQTMEKSEPQKGTAEAIRYSKDLLVVTQKIKEEREKVDSFTNKSATKFIDENDLTSINKVNDYTVNKSKEDFVKTNLNTLKTQEAKIQSDLTTYIIDSVQRNLQKVTNEVNGAVDKAEKRVEGLQNKIDTLKSSSKKNDGVQIIDNIVDESQIKSLEEIEDRLYEIYDKDSEGEATNQELKEFIQLYKQYKQLISKDGTVKFDPELKTEYEYILKSSDSMDKYAKSLDNISSKKENLTKSISNNSDASSYKNLESDLKEIKDAISGVNDKIDSMNSSNSFENIENQLNTLDKKLISVSGDVDKLVDSFNLLSSLSLSDLQKTTLPLYNGINQVFKNNNGNRISSYWEDVKKQVEGSNVQLRELLKNVGLFNTESNSLKLISDGMENSGGIIGDDKVLIARKNHGKNYEEKLSLKQKLDEAYKSGINVSRILDVIGSKESDVIFDIQEKASGSILGNIYGQGEDFVNTEWLQASDEQIKKLISDLIELQAMGINVESNLTNIMYDKNKGFSFIDLDLNTTDFDNNAELMRDHMIRIFGDLEDFYIEKNDSLNADFVTKARKRFENLSEQVQRSYAEAQDSHSPSKDFEQLENDAVDGIVMGANKNEDKLKNVGKQMAENVKEGFNKGIKDIVVDGKSNSSITTLPPDESNISSVSTPVIEQQIKSESELNAEIEKRENIIRELQQLQEKLTVHEDFHGNDRYFADQLPTEEEIREADKRIKQLTGTNNIFDVDKLIQDRNEWLSEVKYSLEEYDDLIKANDQKALDEYTTRGLSRIGGAESFFGYEDNNFSIASKFVEEKEKIQNEINNLYVDLDKLDEKMNFDSNNSSVDNTVQSQEKLQSELKETQEQAEKTAQAIKEVASATASTEQKKDAFPSTEATASVEKLEQVSNVNKEVQKAVETSTLAIKENAKVIDNGELPALDELVKKANEAAYELTKGKDIVSQIGKKQVYKVTETDENGKTMERIVGQFSYVEKSLDGQLKNVLATYDESTGRWNEEVLSLATNFEKVGKEIISLDNKINKLEMHRDKMVSEHPNYDTSADDELIDVQKARRNVLEQTIGLYANEKEYVYEVDAFEKKRIENNRTLLALKDQQNNSQKVKMDEKADKQLIKDWEDAIKFNQEYDTALEKTNELLSKLSVPKELESQWLELIDYADKLRSKLANNEIGVSDYKSSIKSKLSEYNSNVGIQQKRDIDEYNSNVKADNANKLEREKQIWNELTTSLDRYATLQKRIASNNALSTDNEEATELLEHIHELQRSDILPTEKLTASNKKIQQINQTVTDLKAKLKESTLDSLQGSIDKYQKIYDQKRTYSSDFTPSEQYTKNLTELKTAIGDLVKYKDTLKNVSEVTVEQEAELKRLVTTCEKASDSFKSLSASEKGASQIAIDKLVQRINKDLDECTNYSKEAKLGLRALRDELESANPRNLKEITSEIINIENAEIKAGRAGRSFFDTLKNSGFHQLAAQMAGMFGFYDVINVGKEAISTIVSLDDALVDLKKTTAMNSTQLEDFYYNANDVAKQMGVTTEEIITQASSWSRLGYSSQEAATTMAKLSSKFASISPGMSTDEAQEGLVSIMKAFDIDPDDVETEIMDKVNVLGNKFAEENQDVIEGLKRSAAAMSAMGQSFTDTAALFTGGMEILQDSESMGTALRTLSMRVRGYDEETNQLSDDLANVTGEVADLTKTAQDSQGVSLFTDTTQEHYRSMVEYLGDIADRWDQISEKNQTELLQKLFGKNRANESVCPYVQKCA